jgi:hypothetical protein
MIALLNTPALQNPARATAKTPNLPKPKIHHLHKRLQCTHLRGATAVSASPSRRWRCQSSGWRIVRRWMASLRRLPSSTAAPAPATAFMTTSLAFPDLRENPSNGATEHEGARTRGFSIMSPKRNVACEEIPLTASQSCPQTESQSGFLLISQNPTKTLPNTLEGMRVVLILEDWNLIVSVVAAGRCWRCSHAGRICAPLIPWQWGP